MGPWPISRAHSNFGLAISLHRCLLFHSSVRSSVRLSLNSSVMSKFDIYVKVSILINYKTKQPSNLVWNISLTSWLCDIGRDISGMGPIHFVWKPLMLDLNWIYFWLGPLYKLSKSSIYFDLRWVLRILGPIKISRGPIKIWKGPSKF